MKKLFAILAVAGFLTACNDGGAAADHAADTTATAPAADTTPAPVSADTTVIKADTTKAADTTAKH